MIVEIYADIVFVINLITNGAILHIAGVLRRKGAKWRRKLLGAAAAALLYTAAIFTPLAPAINIFTSFIILAPAIPIAFPTANLRDFALSLLAAYICAFALGGVALATVHVFGPGWGLGSYGFAMENFTVQNLAAAIIISFGVLKLAKERIFKKAMTRQALCRFRVHLEGKTVELCALIDTGNELIDPISRHPVIIAEFDKLKPLLPEAVAALYNRREQEDLAALAAGFTQGGFATRIRMIPFNAIGKNGVIAGFRPDKVEIEHEKGARQKDVWNVIIGICDFALSGEGEYHALMNPLLI